MLSELAQLAQGHRRRWVGNHTMDTVALMGEAYMKVRASRMSFENRRMFYAIMSRVMKQVLLDYAKWKTRAKRGGGASHVPLKRLDSDE